MIHYLLRHEHTSPFEQVILTFHAKMPIFVARQWVRHRTARLNEISGRYSVMQDQFYLPETSTLRTQSADNKQARSDEALPEQVASRIQAEFATDHSELYRHYESYIETGLAKEVARINLPLSLYTEWYWQIDLHNLLHFLRLRMDSHAQYEIRVYAEAIARCAKAVAPLAYEAFEEHSLGSVKLSRTEAAALGRLLSGEDPGLEGRNLELFNTKLELLKQRHRDQFEEAPADSIPTS